MANFFVDLSTAGATLDVVPGAALTRPSEGESLANWRRVDDDDDDIVVVVVDALASEEPAEMDEVGRRWDWAGACFGEGLA